MIYNFLNTYTRLSSELYQIVSKPEITEPHIILLNTPLLEKLGIPYSQDQNPELLLGSSKEQPFAQAYAGHQFGHFTNLGDGRAMILGEHINPEDERFDIQLKGSGITRYSRGGDGKAAMSSMIREYMYSYAMKSLGVKTSESIAVLSTNQSVLREEIQNGALLIRVMKSHIRFGTFEYVSRYCTEKELKDFTDYTIERHYPQLMDKDQRYVEFFRSVIENTIDMVVDWYRVGFIHGVMNTDNMSITGETFDYGPCSFINRYDLSTTFSQIDRYRRYSFGNQRDILGWNLGVLGLTLLPLFDKDREMAEEKYKKVMNRFDSLFSRKFLTMMKGKLGIRESTSENNLIHSFISFLVNNKPDYTNTFIELMYPDSINDELYKTLEFQKLREELGKTGLDINLMKKNNPLYILRNYHVEEAISDFKERKNPEKVHTLLNVMTSPYTHKENREKFQQPPSRDFDSSYRTHCNT